MTRLGIIRHGSTSWNKERRAQGSSDIPLDDDGKRDAEKLANRLQNGNWEIIFTSPLERARQTSEIIANRLELPIQEDDRLREVDGGAIEGTTEAERIEKWGKNWREMELGIETRGSVIARGKDFLNEVEEKNAGKHILVISHGSFISQLLKELNPSVLSEQHLKNTSLTELVRRDHEFSCERFNCIDHLVDHA